VIVEPFQRLLAPRPGFLETLREVTREYRIPLIFDEVVTGFRFAYGGAQAYYGVTPDICTLGKVIGGGFPLAAIAGRADMMAHFDRALVGDERFLLQIGTLSGNPVAAVAGLKTMEILRRPGAYERIFATGRRLMEGFSECLKASGVPGQVVGAPPLFDVLFATGEIADYRAMLKGDAEMQKRLTRSLRANGVLKGDSKFYISLAHDEADIGHTLDAFADALRRMASLPEGTGRSGGKSQ
jgi:glutamate-1-semialdehyde 2,1-aminomutase